MTSYAPTLPWRPLHESGPCAPAETQPAQTVSRLGTPSLDETVGELGGDVDGYFRYPLCWVIRQGEHGADPLHGAKSARARGSPRQALDQPPDGAGVMNRPLRRMAASRSASG